MMVDDLEVSVPDMELAPITMSAEGRTLQWQAPWAGNYQVRISSDLNSWTNLPGATISASQAGQNLSYLDNSVNNSSTRYYCIEYQAP